MIAVFVVIALLLTCYFVIFRTKKQLIIGKWAAVGDDVIPKVEEFDSDGRWTTYIEDDRIDTVYYTIDGDKLMFSDRPDGEKDRYYTIEKLTSSELVLSGESGRKHEYKKI